MYVYIYTGIRHVRVYSCYYTNTWVYDGDAREAYVYVNTTRAVSVKQTPNKLVQGMMVHNLLFFFILYFFPNIK